MQTELLRDTLRNRALSRRERAETIEALAVCAAYLVAISLMVWGAW